MIGHEATESIDETSNDDASQLTMTLGRQQARRKHDGARKGAARRGASMTASGGAAAQRCERAGDGTGRMWHGGPEMRSEMTILDLKMVISGHASRSDLARSAAASSCVAGPDGPLQVLTAAGPSQICHGGPQNGVRNDDFGPQNDDSEVPNDDSEVLDTIIAAAI